VSKKGEHLGKRTTLAEYKRLYILALESRSGDEARQKLRSFEVQTLADTSLGITSKTLARAQDEALEERRDRMTRANA